MCCFYLLLESVTFTLEKFPFVLNFYDRDFATVMSQVYCAGAHLGTCRWKFVVARRFHSIGNPLTEKESGFYGYYVTLYNLLWWLPQVSWVLKLVHIYEDARRSFLCRTRVLIASVVREKMLFGIFVYWDLSNNL